ncbi:DUF3892 domain-containing protein [Leptospira interrogans]|uniref:DUF3892 domain-containing protein n=1 Tax=Leptospira interrogans TaxID=173 RepID=UPI000773311A|nr:DUF3892 domain-containing protein [Leptospira interrogans]
MSKWADYLISKVCYASGGTPIKEVATRQDNGESVSTSTQSLTRSQVITKIENGSTFVTIFEKDGKWNKGANVEIVKIDGEKYIRTDKNSTKRDNLENLPTYNC